MADKIPVKAVFTGADVTALGEYAAGDTIPVASGGTGSTGITGIVKGSGTAYSAATAGTDYAAATTGTNAELLANNGSGGFSNVTVGSGLSLTTGTLTASSTMTYPGAGIANSTGSAWGTSYTTSGSGTVVALATSPSFTTPTLGVASATTVNKVTLTAPATGSTLTIANGKTLTASNTLTFTGTDASSVAFGTGGTVIYSGGALGTPSSGTLTSCTGLPIGTGVSGLGTNVATFLATPSSANLAAALTGETGSGSAVFATSPALTTPVITGLDETKTAPTISTNTLTLNCSLGNVFAVSLNANITTLTFSNVPTTGTAYALTLSFTADGTARTVTWGAAVKWPGGTAPTLTSTNAKVDTFVLTTWDAGTTWYAFVAGQNS